MADDDFDFGANTSEYKAKTASSKARIQSWIKTGKKKGAGVSKYAGKTAASRQAQSRGFAKAVYSVGLD